MNLKLTLVLLLVLVVYQETVEGRSMERKKRGAMDQSSDDSNNGHSEGTSDDTTEEDLTCDVPPVSNGAYTYGGAAAMSPIAAGQSITLECNDGYDMVPPIAGGSITCTASGDGTSADWVPPPPSCLHDDCYGVTCSGHGTCVDGTPHDGQYTCDCDIGYTGPDCGTKRDCGPAPTSSSVTYSGGTQFGDTGTYTCVDPDYVLVGEDSNTCQADDTHAYWMYPTAPTCEPQRCSAPGSVENGHYETDSGPEYFVGSSATLHCDRGYIPDPEDTIHCQLGAGAGGSPGWTPTLYCIKRDCGPVPTSSSVTYSGGTQFGDTGTYSCVNAGYELVGVETNTCEADDTHAYWVNPTAPTCRPMCTDPAATTNVHWTPDPVNGYHTIGTVLTFECPDGEGYTLHGDLTSTCMWDNCDGCSAYWSNPLPTCYRCTVGPCGDNNEPCPPGTTCQNNPEGHNCLINGDCYCGPDTAGWFTCNECQVQNGPCTAQDFSSVICPANKDGYCKHRWTTNGENQPIESERWFCATDGQCHDSEDQHSATDSPGGSKLYEECEPGICHFPPSGKRKKRSVKIH